MNAPDKDFAAALLRLKRSFESGEEERGEPASDLFSRLGVLLDNCQKFSACLRIEGGTDHPNRDANLPYGLGKGRVDGFVHEFVADVGHVSLSIEAVLWEGHSKTRGD